MRTDASGDPGRSAWRRLHPLDAAAAAVALLAIAWVLIQVRGYQYRGSVASGFVRTEPAVVAIVVGDPIQAALARERWPGPVSAETTRGPDPIEVTSVDPVAGTAAVRLAIALRAEEHGRDRWFWNDQRLRRGAPLVFGDRDVQVAGTILSVGGLPEPAP